MSSKVRIRTTFRWARIAGSESERLPFSDCRGRQAPHQQRRSTSGHGPLGFVPEQVPVGPGFRGDECTRPEDAPDEPEVDPRRSLQQQLDSIVDTDHDQKTKARKEMGILRKHLFGKNVTGHCDICNKELPVGFIVAAHIKPRRDCGPSERKDLNVVMRACRFGCDELFERSYIQVNEKGLIEAGINLGRSTNDLKKEAMKVISRETSAFNKETRGYFEWHRNHSKRKLKA